MTQTIGWIIFLWGLIYFWVVVYSVVPQELENWVIAGMLMISGAILAK